MAVSDKKLGLKDPPPPHRSIIQLIFHGKIFEKFKGESANFAVLKGTCFAWGGSLNFESERKF